MAKRSKNSRALTSLEGFKIIKHFGSKPMTGADPVLQGLIKQALEEPRPPNHSSY